MAGEEKSCDSYNPRPSESSTRRMSSGCGTFPRLANAAYAAVIACSVTSPDPSANDGTLGTSPTPRFFAYCTVRAIPTSCSSRTAARLLDVLRAVRSVIESAALCSSSGDQPPRAVAIGSLRLVITVAGVYPASIAAAYTNGLNAEPG